MLCYGEDMLYVCASMYFTANEDCILMKQLDYCQTTQNISLRSFLLRYVCYSVNRKRNCHMTSTEAQNEAEKYRMYSSEHTLLFYSFL